MAIISGAVTSFSLADKREQIDKKVWDVEPLTTPALTMLKDGDAKVRVPKWFVDTIRAPVTNATIEGDAASQAKSKTVRSQRQNIVQQFTDEFVTTDISDEVDRSDGKKSSVEQRLKQRVAVKRDMEQAITGNAASVVGDNTTAPVLAGMESWLVTNVDRGTSGANGGYNTGTGLVAAPTDGTRRYLTEAMVKKGVRTTYNSGEGNPELFLMGSFQKEKFDTFVGLGQLVQNVESKDKSVIVNTTVDVYRTAWGKHRAMVDRYMRTYTLLGLDMDYWKWLEMQKLQSYDLPTNGLSVAEGIKSAGTLQASNEKANFVIADLLDA